MTRHVIVVSIDGLRPDAIGRYGAPTLRRLAREGSHSLSAETILPSTTLPSHTSMLTGVGPEAHGVTWNDNAVEERGTVRTPTIFAIARRAGLRTAAFFSKGKFNHLVVPGSLDFARVPAGDGRWFSGRTADHVVRYLEAERPNLLFVHLADADYAGHVAGWMGTVYGWAVGRVDGALAEILAAADAAFGRGEYTLIVTADHGGHGRSHGSTAHADVTIPWIAWGRGVRRGAVLGDGIHTTDTAATALWLLGVNRPSSLLGDPIEGAFVPTGRDERAVGS